jgi:hypothetical protein
MPGDLWLMTVSRAVVGFHATKSGRCWFRICSSREQVIAVRHELVANRIAFYCRKLQVSRPSEQTSLHFSG